MIYCNLVTAWQPVRVIIEDSVILKIAILPQDESDVLMYTIKVALVYILP